MDTQSTPNLSELTAEIVSAFVSNNNIPPDQLPELISEVHSALREHQTAKLKRLPSL